MNDTIGTLYVVAAPSGGGKTSLVAQLLTRLSNIELSISHTTREKRPGEVNGRHYHFIAPDEFEEMVRSGEFIEHASVFGRHYGTSHAQVQSRLKAGIDVVLDIDWQGARQLRAQFEQVVSVFILPPSLEVLRQRLTQRGRDEERIIEQRMHKAQDEMSHFKEFDFLVINDDFDHALAQLMSIVESRRLTVTQQSKKHANLLSLLLLRP